MGSIISADIRLKNLIRGAEEVELINPSTMGFLSFQCSRRALWHVSNAVHWLPHVGVVFQTSINSPKI